MPFPLAFKMRLAKGIIVVKHSLRLGVQEIAGFKEICSPPSSICSVYPHDVDGISEPLTGVVKAGRKMVVQINLLVVLQCILACLSGSARCFDILCIYIYVHKVCAR